MIGRQKDAAGAQRDGTAQEFVRLFDSTITAAIVLGLMVFMDWPKTWWTVAIITAAWFAMGLLSVVIKTAWQVWRAGDDDRS